MLTEQEREDLERECEDARYRCREAWKTILQIRKILKCYETEHWRWKRRFEAADRKLAEHDRLTKIPLRKERRKSEEEQISVVLTKEQILQIAEELGVEVEIDG